MAGAVVGVVAYAGTYARFLLGLMLRGMLDQLNLMILFVFLFEYFLRN